MDDSVAISNVATANQHRQSQLKAPHRRSEIDIGKQKRQFQASTSRVTCILVYSFNTHTLEDRFFTVYMPYGLAVAHLHVHADLGSVN